MLASLLRLNAIRIMKSVLARTAASKLQDVLEAAFCEEEEDNEDYVPEDQPEEEPTVSLGESSTSTKQKAPQLLVHPNAKVDINKKVAFVLFQMHPVITQLLVM